MTSKKNSQTLFSIVIVAVVGFLAYKVLPGLFKKTGAASQSRYGGGGITTLPPAYKPPAPTSKNSPASAGGSFSPQRQGGGIPSGGGGFGAWLYNLTRNQTLAQDGPLSPANFTGAAGYDSPALDALQIPTDPLQLLDLQGTSIFDPNILSQSDLTDLLGSTGPDANGSYSVAPDYSASTDFSSLDTGYDPSLDSFQFDQAALFGGGDFSGGGGGGGYSYSDQGSGYADTYSPDLNGDYIS